MRGSNLLGGLVLVAMLAVVGPDALRGQDGGAGDTAALAEDEAGFLERQIAGLLGGEGREVRVLGLEGALSSQARIGLIEIADADGVWLRVREAELDWRRVALLRRRLEVQALQAALVEVIRRPLPPPAQRPALTAEPAAEAEPFSLPQLPLSVNVQRLAIAELRLGETVLGTAAELRVEGSAALAEGDGDVDLQIDRTDGPGDSYGIAAAFEDESRQLSIDLDVQEARDGIVGTLAGIPGSPPLSLSVAGDGPLGDFTAEIDLSTDGEQRLAGTVALRDTPEGPAARRITADLGGDVTPLFLPDYRGFFGPDVALDLEALQGPDYGLGVETLSLRANGLRLDGTARLGSDFVPLGIDLDGRVGTASGLPVVLPAGGPPLLLHGADLTVRYDADDGDRFSVALTADGVQRTDGLLIDRLSLAAEGVLERGTQTAVAGIETALTARVEGFAATDPGLDAAVGQAVAANGIVAWSRGAPLEIRALDLTAGEATARGRAALDGIETGNLAVSAALDAGLPDLARFAGLAGLDLSGAVEAALTAEYDLPTGAFDAMLDGVTRDLRLGNAEADALLAGTVALGLTASRDARGIALERLRASGRRLDLDGTLTLDAQGLPDAVSLAGRLGDPAGEAVALPVPGRAVTLQGATIDLQYDAAAGEDVRLRATVQDLADATAGRLRTARVAADGRLVKGAGTVQALAGDLEFTAGGIETPDAALAALLEDGVRLEGAADWSRAEDRLRVRDLLLDAAGARLSGAADLEAVRAGAPRGTVRGRLESGALSAFAPLLGQPLQGSITADLDADLDTETGTFDVSLDGRARDVSLGNAGADNLLDGTVAIALDAARDADGVELSRLLVDGARLRLDATAALTPDFVPRDVAVRGQFGAVDGGPTTLPVPGGAVLEALDLVALYDADAGDAFLLDLDGRGLDRPGLARIARAVLLADGALTQEAGALTGLDAALAARIEGVSGANAALSDALAPGLVLDAEADWRAQDDTLTLTGLSVATGEVVATGAGRVRGLTGGAPAPEARLTIDTGPLSRFARLAGTALRGRLTGAAEGGFDPATGHFSLDADLDGDALAAGIPVVDAILSGRSELVVQAARDADGLTIDRAVIDTAELDFQASGGTDAAGEARIDVAGRLRDAGLLVPGFSDPVALDATLSSPDFATWSVDGGLDGPAGLRADARGIVLQPGGALDLAVTGTLPLSLANAFIAPRTLEGSATLDARLAGAPALAAVSGTLEVPGARFADPGTGIALENIAVGLDLADSRAALDASAALATGGTLQLDGPITLTGQYPADLELTLTDLRVLDPTLYEIFLGGAVTMSGPLAGGARIAGQIDIDEGELNISGALGRAGALIEVRHLGEPEASARTRRYAGLEQENARRDGGGGPVYPLDLVISAPRQVFVRGRGLDVELGGEVAVGGTTAAPVGTGSLELIRGRLDLLARRLTFDTARITLLGDFEPVIEMVARSSNAGVTSLISITGPVSDPEIEFSSQPDLPEDEVLAQLFFGKALQDLTPLEIAQLGAAIRQLTGAGGTGPLGFAREALGVDQLSLGTDEDGGATVTAGRYITERVYSDVTVNEDGRSEVELNYELRDDLTVQGGFSNDGDTGVGFAFERDY